MTRFLLLSVISPVLDFWVLGVIPKAGLGEIQHWCQSEIDGYLPRDIAGSHLSIQPARFRFVSYISFIHAAYQYQSSQRLRDVVKCYVGEWHDCSVVVLMFLHQTGNIFYTWTAMVKERVAAFRQACRVLGKHRSIFGHLPISPPKIHVKNDCR